uniref:Centrosomal protein C10orf90 N-terminal domain-containing protein n=1 Tax=Nothoprocta perdicaria TaxID=30464 RepID=A0A8C6YVG7_NOTPE
MASSRVISRMTDKSKGNGPALPMGMGADPTQRTVADPGLLNIHSTSTWLPSRSGTRASLDAVVAHPDSRVTEEDRCPRQQRGFTSITVTARRVGGPVASEAGPLPHGTPLPSRGSPANLSITSLKVSESCSGLHDKPQDQLFDSANEETIEVPRGSSRREAAPLSFTSCVHLRLSQQCPSTIYYLDKSLHVCIDQPQIKHQKVHRSALSFRINCSSSRLTADGVDGIANGEPLEEILKSKLLGENKTPLRASWSADIIQNNVIKKHTTDEGYLGTKHPSKSACPPQVPAVVDIPTGPNNVIVVKKESNKQSGSNRTMLSIWLPRPSNEAGKGIFRGSNRKQCAMGMSCPTAPASQEEPTAASIGSSPRRDPSRGTSRSKESRPPCFPRPKLSLSESMCNIKTLSRIILEANIPGQNQFLQGEEALEIHKPRFLSRSRARLQRLEHKVQLRKAQQSDAPARTRAALLLHKLSSTSFSGKKRQYTIPHPLSDNLFKPKERFIPEKEMHMRSKRIYDNLPEVKKKQEEKQKRVILQSNRLRVELFKKVMVACECK